MSDALALMLGLVDENGTPWGEVAAPFQREDAAAICADPGSGPRRHFIVRPRGGSKTTDAAAAALALMVSEAPRRSRSYLYASDSEQAGEVLDALSGFVSRTPGLAGAVEMGSSRLMVRATGATLSVESSDAASAWSKRPWLVVTDELTSWPTTRNHTSLWTAIVSALPKRKDSRLVVLSMAGSPAHFAFKIWGLAQSSPDWRASSTPGPTPWWDPVDVESTRLLLTAAQYRRYVLAEWVETDESLSAAEHVSACVRVGAPVLPPRAGVSYVACLDVGTRRDLTALTIAHAGATATGPGVIVDRVIHWRPKTGITGRVDLREVEDTVRRVCREYKARLRFDRSQAEQLSQNLQRDGVAVEEFVFSTASTNRLAKALHNALRDHALSLPDDPELISELQTARLVETGPGTLKMVNPAGSHDDVATTVGMAIVHLTDHPSGVGVFGGLSAGRRSLGPGGASIERPQGNVSALVKDALDDPWPSVGAAPGGRPRPAAVVELSEAERWSQVVAMIKRH
jgi:hypothetical protein